MHVKTLAASLIALTALAGLPHAAQAGCIPVVGSDGSGNTCFGVDALSRNEGAYNTAVGGYALRYNVSGNYNSAIGAFALIQNSSGSVNSAIGLSALRLNITGEFNSATGASSLYHNIAGSNNTASGFQSGGKQTGSNNTSLGAKTGWVGEYEDGSFLTGSNNIAIGYQAGSQWGVNNTAVSNNIAIGSTGLATDANTIRIGTQGTQKTVYVAGIFDATRKMKGTAVLVNNLGQLYIAKSSLRYKLDVQDMGAASEKLMQLRPVTFRYKQADEDGTRPLQYGLIAEEVAKTMPDLALYNSEGTPETVDYQALPSLLLNEYQKQNRELAETKARLASAEASHAAEMKAMAEQMAALKLAVERLAAAQPSTLAVLEPVKVTAP